MSNWLGYPFNLKCEGRNEFKSGVRINWILLEWHLAENGRCHSAFREVSVLQESNDSGNCKRKESLI